MNNQQKIKDLLSQTVGKAHYNGWNNRTTYGYHSYNIGSINIQGQRNPRKRISAFEKYVKLEEKTVVDFGCNVGSMLHHIPGIKKGIGLDFDKDCIFAASEISKILNLNNLNFLQHDFDKDSYKSLLKVLPEIIDVSLLLSLGSWVASWRDLYSICLDKSKTIILEINNMQEGKSQLDFFESANKEIKEVKEASRDDSTGNLKRKTFIIN